MIDHGGWSLAAHQWLALGASEAYAYVTDDGQGVVRWGVAGDRRRARALCALERSAGDVCGALDLMEEERRTTALCELARALHRLADEGITVTVDALERRLSEVA